MKKVLCIAMATFMAVSLAHAEETSDGPGQLGVGYQGVVMGDLMSGLAFRMKPAPFGGQLELVQGSLDMENALTADLLILKGKGYYSLIQRQNSAFYVGASLGYWMGEIHPDGGGKTEIDGFSIAPLMGVEWNFSELPELGINFEVSYEIDMLGTDIEGSTASPDIDLYGITVSTGVIYYF